MEIDCLIPIVNEATAAKKRIDDVFKEKSLDVVMREGGNYKRELLAELVFDLKSALTNLLNGIQQHGLLSVINPSDAFVRKDELQSMLESIIPKITESVKERLTGPLPQPAECCIKEQTTVNAEKRDHVVVIHGEIGDNNFSGFNDDQWNTVIKKNLSSKLKSFPIKKSLKTKEGKACLFVENENTMNEVKEALQGQYNVEANKAKSKAIYPKVKMFDLDTSVYTKESTDILKKDILDKNMAINGAYQETGSFFEVLFIDTKFNFAILKMSENIRAVIKSHGNRVYLDLTSHAIKDNFHVTQCYKCQKFGHKADSPHCSGIQVCLYCSGNHLSKECGVKNDQSKHVCSNCKISPQFKNKACGHQSNSIFCPVFMKETETVMKKTAGLTSDDFLRHQERLHKRQTSSRFSL